MKYISQLHRKVNNRIEKPKIITFQSHKRFLHSSRNRGLTVMRMLKKRAAEKFNS